METWIPYEKFKIEEGYYINGIKFNDDGLIIRIYKGELVKEIIFPDIYGYKYSNESGMIDRLSRIPVNLLRKNRIFVVVGSLYKEEYEFQSSGTRPMDEVEHFIILDDVDTIVEILAVSEPIYQFV